MRQISHLMRERSAQREKLLLLTYGSGILLREYGRREGGSDLMSCLCASEFLPDWEQEDELEVEVVVVLVVGEIVDVIGSVYGDVLSDGSTSTMRKRNTGRGFPSVDGNIIFGGDRERLRDDNGGLVGDIDGE